MRSILILSIVLLYATGVLAQAVRPVIPEVFAARIRLYVRHNNSNEIRGDGIHEADQGKGFNLEIFRFESHSDLETYRLQRYDLGIEYELHEDSRRCDKRALSGSMPANWAWVKQANFAGTRNEQQQVLDLWRMDMGFSTMELAVNAKNPNVPIWVRRNSTSTNVTMYYESFSNQPNGSNFAVPKDCQGELAVSRNFTMAACRSRADMIAVAKAWASAKVPYNQGATHDGYREDCSGYVSACWAEAKPGLVTSTFHTVGHDITKDELSPGDALLYAAEHIVLFGGWTDSAKTHYTAFEETQPGEGTVTRTTPYPYWYSTSSFKPFRSNNVC